MGCVFCLLGKLTVLRTAHMGSVRRLWGRKFAWGVSCLWGAGDTKYACETCMRIWVYASSPFCIGGSFFLSFRRDACYMWSYALRSQKRDTHGWQRKAKNAFDRLCLALFSSSILGREMSHVPRSLTASEWTQSLAESSPRAGASTPSKRMDATAC